MSKQNLPKFQKRHYDAIVAIPSVSRPQEHAIIDMMRTRIVRDLADLFAADNPRFDKTRFLTACNVNAVINPLEAV